MNVKEWTPIKISPQSSSINKNPSSNQLKPLQSSSSLKDIPNQPANGSLKSFTNFSQPKNVAFKNDIPAPSQNPSPNASIRLKQRSGIDYDISAGRGNFDDGYHSDYAASLKQSYSSGNLASNAFNKPQSSGQLPSSSSTNSLSHPESGNYSGYNQKKQKPNQRGNNNRINRSTSYAPRSNDRYKPPMNSNSSNKSNSNSNNNFNNSNRNSNNNRNYTNRSNNHNQDNNNSQNAYSYQPKPHSEPPTNS